jgi:hypothetical protein
MKRILSCLLLLSASLLTTPAAWATWGSFISTGNTTGIGAPSCAPIAKNLVACGVRSSKSLIMVNEFNGTSWGTWKSLPGSVVSDPTCTSDGSGNVFCAATVANGYLQVTELTGGVWSAPVKVKAALYSEPSCAEVTAGQVLCAGRTSSGLSWSLYNGTSWSVFANLATSAISSPSCSSDDNHGVICAFYTAGYATLVNRFTSGAWEGFLSLGGVGHGKPECMSMDNGGSVVCVADWYSSGIYGNRFNKGTWAVSGWGGYVSLGGLGNDNARCTSQGAGEIVCGVLNPIDNAFYVDVFNNGTNWTGFFTVGGAGFGSPSCASLGTGQVVCVVMGLDNKLKSVVGS